MYQDSVLLTHAPPLGWVSFPRKTWVSFNYKSITVNPASGSHLAKAVTYAKNQKPYMENYLLDVRCSISNNITRPYAVGRKNFLFHDTIKGARASSIIYSLVETAKLNNLNIYAYLETVLLYMSDYKNEPEGIEELMPWSEMIQQRCRIKLK